MSDSVPGDLEHLYELAGVAATGTDPVLCRSEFARATTALEERWGAPARIKTLRGLLERLVRARTGAIDGLEYPEAVKGLLRREFVRIHESVAVEADEHFDLASHRFRSDLRICCFGRIPVGPEHMELDGVPRSILYRGGSSQAWNSLRLLMTAGGFRPYYVLHLAYGIPPAAFLLVYSRQAQETMFRNLAGALRMNPGVRGVLASSWWHDPQLDEFSPYLAYLRTGWTNGGASLLRWGAGDQTVELATRNSPTRQKLVSEGRYRPTTYMVVWPRRSLLEWADGQAETGRSNDPWPGGSKQSV